MEEKSKLSTAALNGLYLAAITVACSLLTSALELKGVASILVWVVKFAGTNYLLYYFMKDYSNKNNITSYGKNVSYGFLISSFSAIVCACYSFISLTFLFPDSVSAAIEVMQQTMAQQQMTSEEESAVEMIITRLPEISLFGTLIYLIIYGAIAAAIIANFSKKESNPFSEREEVE